MSQLYGKSVVSIVLCYCLYYVAGIIALLRGGGGGYWRYTCYININNPFNQQRLVHRAL